MEEKGVNNCAPLDIIMALFRSKEMGTYGVPLVSFCMARHGTAQHSTGQRYLQDRENRSVPAGVRKRSNFPKPTTVSSHMKRIITPTGNSGRFSRPPRKVLLLLLASRSNTRFVKCPQRHIVSLARPFSWPRQIVWGASELLSPRD